MHMTPLQVKRVVSWTVALGARFREHPGTMKRRRTPERPSRVARSSRRYREEVRSLGAQIRALRERRGWTLEEASQAMQLDSKHLWKIETGWRDGNVTLATLVRIAEALGQGVGELFPALAPVKRGTELEVVEQPSEAEKYRSCVPLLDLAAAAGSWGAVQVVEPRAWVRPGVKRALRPGMFVAQVVGRSMEPKIPDGAHCLFASPVTGTRQGKIVLAQHREISDPETGGRYTVKRYESEKVYDELGGWRHREIRLAPINPRFQPIVLEGVPEEEVAVIAELVEVLRPAKR